MDVLGNHSTTILTALAIPALLLLVRQWTRPVPIAGIPHFPLSFLGDLPTMAGDTIKYGTIFEPGAFAWKGLAQLGPMFQFFIGPFARVVVLADAQEIEEVFKVHARSMDLAPMIQTAFGGVTPKGMVALPTNDTWRRHRRITSPLMANSYLTSMTPAIAGNTFLLVDYWRKKMASVKAAGGTCFSCVNDFEYSSLDTIIEIIAGRPLNSVHNATSQLDTCKPIIDAHGGAVFELSNLPLFTSIRYLVGSIGSTINMPPMIAQVNQYIVTSLPGFKRHMATLVGFIDSSLGEIRQDVQVARDMKEEYEAKSFLGMIANKEDMPGAEQLPPDELRDETITYIFGGHDTTTSVMQWCMKFFADNPHVQLALHKELISALEDAPNKRLLTYTDVTSDRTPYLEATVHEVLRLSAVAEGVGKIVTQPFKILGREIPTGTMVIFGTRVANLESRTSNIPNLRSIDSQRSGSGAFGKGLWEKPEEFDPARWIGEDGKFNLKAGFSLPFGIGPRSCAGKALALLELRLYIATLSLAFFFDKTPPELSDYKPKVVVTRSPITVYVAPREWEEVTA